MKISISLFALAGAALPTLAGAAPATPRLVGEVRAQGATEKPYLWLGGAYFPGKGYRTDAQSKGALHAGTRWQLFGLRGAGPSVTSGPLLPPDVPEGYASQLRQAVPGNVQMLAIANALPNAQPRLPRMQSLNQESYQRAAAGLLRAQGLNIERAQLTQLMRVDLDGDGVEEVLFSARSRPNYGDTPEEKRGDYSLIGLRYVDGGQVKTVTLASSVSTKDVAFAAPYKFEIMSCVDVDGDGKMEIAGANNYYEGNGFDVWRFDGRDVKIVMSAGWGA